MDELDRCLAFDRRVTLRGASERLEIPGGWVLTEFEQTGYPPDTVPGLAEMLVGAQKSLREGTAALRFGAGETDALQSMCTLFMDEEPDGHRMAMVEQVATLPSHRQRGLARAVILAALGAAREGRRHGDGPRRRR
jgi:GNAT superfamily N-acetyltransferase